MEMIPVDSGWIQAVGYDSATKKLRVQCKSGTYEYDDVPEHKHEALMKADSAGRHFMTHIRHDHNFSKL